MSSSKIDSLYFLPSADNTRRYLVIESGDEQLYNLSMAGQSTDGAYGIHLKRGDENITKVFGYYSNGGVMEKYTIIKIMDDTLTFKPIY